MKGSDRVKFTLCWVTTFLTALLSLALSVPAVAQLHKSGYRVHSSKIDDPDFYSSDAGIGKEIKSIYKEIDHLRNLPLGVVPGELDSVVDLVHKYILEDSEVKNVRSSFYSGPGGIYNGEGFTFNRDELPSKLVRLSFCFGFDPLVFTGLVKQESHFYRFAKSPTKASGFTQLTTIAIKEVNEQLGVYGPGYHGEGAPETFHRYIQCYLGEKKKWSNFWEDPILSPEHKKIASYITIIPRKKEDRVKLNRALQIQKHWLNHDPDRNLIYGAILFKLYLGHFGGYSMALRQYNVSHKDSYLSRVERFYSKMEKIYREEQISEAPAGNSHKKVQEVYYALSNEKYRCQVSREVLFQEYYLSDIMTGFYSAEERQSAMFESLNRQGYCENKETEI